MQASGVQDSQMVIICDGIYSKQFQECTIKFGRVHLAVKSP